jgi:formate dehydrogenase subunit gamma
LFVVCLLASVFQVQAANPQSAPPPPPNSLLTIDPGTDLWREVRQREGEVRGTTQVKSTDAGVLINSSGQKWRQYRMEKLIPIAGIAIAVVLAAIVLFRIIRGKIPIPGGRSGIKILRFTTNQRYAHWTTATLFVILGLTGLVLLLGRMVLLPVFGPEVFSPIALGSKYVHNYLGPLFVIALTWLFVLFLRGNMPKPSIDLKWLMSGGGMFGKHAHAECYNAGEKGWFWLATLGGLVVIVSGLVLDFPIFGQTRATMELYHIIHSISAVVLIVVSLGHIYMGTAAIEGTFEIMQTGYCDANWAKDHHDLWYEKVKDSAGASQPQESESQPGMAQRPSTDST